MPTWLLPMARGRVLPGKFSPPSPQVKAVSDVQDLQCFTNEAWVFSSEDSIPSLLHLVEVYTTPEISPHDSPAGSSLWLSQGPNCLSRLGHVCHRGEPCGRKAQAGEFSSVAGSQGSPCSEVTATPATPGQRPGPGLLQVFSAMTGAVSTSSDTPGSPPAPAE